MPHDEVTPWNRPLAQPGATQGYSAANVEAINHQFRVVSQNFQSIEKIFETLRYNMRAAINEDVDKLRDEIRKELNIGIINESFKTINKAIKAINENFKGFVEDVDLLREEIRYEIRKEFDADKLRDGMLRADIRKENAAEMASLRVEVLSTLNENLKGADKNLAEFGFNVSKVIADDIGKVSEQIRKEFSVNNLVAEIRKANETSIAALRADTTIQLAAMRADITMHQTRQPPPRKVPPSDLKRK
jgi:hypothetical protein